MSLVSVITKRQKTYKVQRYQGVVKTLGKKVPTWAAEVDIDLLILPVGQKAMQSFPDGTLTAADVIIHQAGAQNLNEKDRITYKGKLYEVRDTVDRDDYGGFSMYIGKLLNDSN